MVKKTAEHKVKQAIDKKDFKILYYSSQALQAQLHSNTTCTSSTAHVHVQLYVHVFIATQLIHVLQFDALS